MVHLKMIMLLLRVFTSTLMFLRAPVPTWKSNVEAILEMKIFSFQRKYEEAFKITMETNHVGGNAIIGSSMFLCHIWKDEHIALKRTLLYNNIYLYINMIDITIIVQTFGTTHLKYVHSEQR